MGTYTPNYNLYMPSIGEQGWGNLVSNNFEILDTNLNNLQNHINTINTQIDTINENLTTLNLLTDSGTRILTIPHPNVAQTVTISTSNSAYNYSTNSYVSINSYNTPINIQSISNSGSRCMIIISACGDITISGNLDTYPAKLNPEKTPTNSTYDPYTRTINFNSNYYTYNPITLTYTAEQNNSKLTMQYSDYLNFVNKTIPIITQTEYVGQYTLSIPDVYTYGTNLNGDASTETKTCNGGGGGVQYGDNINGRAYSGGNGCIFGQYSGGSNSHPYGYGYGSGTNVNKYRCALVIVVNGNLTINSTITQIGGDGNSSSGGYGGGAFYLSSDYYGAGGGGGAPVFIYYTGSYTNNGTINTAGGNGNTNRDSYFTVGAGGAGGIKVTKITI